MNKIIPFTNSIILYFLFPFYFFISKFSKSKNFFSNFFKNFSAANYILWGILVCALYPPPPYVYMLISKIFHSHIFPFLPKFSTAYLYMHRMIIH